MRYFRQHENNRHVRALTFTRHPNFEAFLEATVLTPVAVQPNYQAPLITQAFILNRFLNTSPKETLNTHYQHGSSTAFTSLYAKAVMYCIHVENLYYMYTYMYMFMCMQR